MAQERRPVAQSGLTAVELQAAGVEQFGQPDQEQPAEQLGKDPHRQQERWPGRHPALAIERDAAAGHDHVEVRMMRQCRAPGVEHGGDADAGTKVPPVGGDGRRRFRRRAEQQVVDRRLVLERDVGDFGGQAEDHVEVADWQQVGLPRGQPLAGCGPLALGAMPVAAAVVGDAPMAAVLASLDVAPKSCGAAGLDRRHDRELAEAEVAGMGRPKGGPVAAEDVGDLEGGSHPGQPPGLAPTLSPGLMRAMILSSGLVTVRTVLVATRV